MQINVKMDLTRFNQEARNYARNLAYSTAQALNDTAVDAQGAIRDHMARTFHLRSASTRNFLFRSIKIFAFANVRASRPYALIGVDNKSRLLLSLFEEGGERTAFVGRRVAVPIIRPGGARSSLDSKISKQKLITSLNMRRAPTAQRKNLSTLQRNVRRRRGGHSSYTFWQGNDATFLLEHSRREPFGGIFQRTAKGKADGAIALLYALKPSVKVRAVLDFVRTVGSTFDARFQAHLDRRFFHVRGIGG
jgi:hypothetical protein